MFQLLLLAFVLVPIAEIWVLIEVGSVIGAVPTIALVVLTAVVGAALIRMQGLRTVARVQAQMAAGEVPAIEMMEGAFILFAGALLLTPGFVTDAIGFACLVPPLRLALIRGLLARGIRMHADASFRGSMGGQSTGSQSAGNQTAGHRPPGPGSRPGRVSPPRQGHTIEGDFERERPD